MIFNDDYLSSTTTTVKTGELVLALNWQVGRGGSGSVSGTRPEVLVLLVLVVVVALLGTTRPLGRQSRGAAEAY